MLCELYYSFVLEFWLFFGRFLFLKFGELKEGSGRGREKERKRERVEGRGGFWVV